MSGHHHHSHGAATDRAFKIALSLNVAFIGVEVLFGFYSNSLALLADAGHNFSDVLGLAMAWGARMLARKKSSERKTYGLRRTTIFSSFFSSLFLFMTLGVISWEALHRLFTPTSIDGTTLILVAGLGVLINGISAWLFFKESKEDLNVKGAFLHLATDAATSLGVMLSGVLILLWNWTLLDPLVSLIITGIIFMSVWQLSRDSLNLALDGVPRHIDTAAVKNFLLSQDGITDLHDLHIWAMSTTEVALTAHVIMPTPPGSDDFLNKISTELQKQFGIAHPTIQVEKGDTNTTCEQEDHVHL